MQKQLTSGDELLGVISLLKTTPIRSETTVPDLQRLSLAIESYAESLGDTDDVSDLEWSMIPPEFRLVFLCSGLASVQNAVHLILTNLGEPSDEALH